MVKRNYWLMKSEPGDYSIDDLKKDGKIPWTGVRNYQARNFMRDKMKNGDLILFYHSNADPSGVAGVGQICRESYPDFTARDPKSRYFAPPASEENPIWMMVDVAFVEKFNRLVSLQDLKQEEKLSGLMVLRKGMRLSIQPVSKEHFTLILKLGRARG